MNQGMHPQIDQESFLGFLENYYPNVNYHFYNFEYLGDKVLVTIEITAVRYFDNQDSAHDFEKHGYNPCCFGKSTSEPDELCKIKAEHRTLKTFEFSQSTFKELCEVWGR